VIRIVAAAAVLVAGLLVLATEGAAIADALLRIVLVLVAGAAALTVIIVGGVVLVRRLVRPSEQPAPQVPDHSQELPAPDAPCARGCGRTGTVLIAGAGSLPTLVCQRCADVHTGRIQPRGATQ
jgi:hypothetical protein